MTDKQAFLFPRSRYYGQVLPENLVFNARFAGVTAARQLYCQPGNRWQTLSRRILPTNSSALETAQEKQKAIRDWH